MTREAMRLSWSSRCDEGFVHRVLKVASTFLSMAFFYSLCISVTVQAQQNVGRVLGVVRDPHGAVVAKASITAIDRSTGVQTAVVSNELGEYLLPALPIGSYDLIVSASGFKKIDRESVRILAGVTLTFDFSLEIGRAAETVDVTASANTVDTSPDSSGTTRATEEIGELPLMQQGIARTSLTFLRTLPGVSPSYGADDSAEAAGISVAAINGAPGGTSRLYYDGMPISSAAHDGMYEPFAIPPEAVSEMRLSTSSTSEYGWDNGVSVNVVTKSGSNQLHGSLFEYLRNDDFDAKNWFATSVSEDKQNEFGFTLGGPVVIPHVYNGTSKTFFFTFFDGFRYLSQPGGVVTSVPDSLEKQGNFSEFLGPQVGTDALGRPVYQGEIYDPSSTTTLPNGTLIRNPFPGNIIPASEISSVSKAFQAGFPAPNGPGLALNWSGFGARSPNSSNKGLVKIDHSFGGGRQNLAFLFEDFERTTFFGGIYPGSILETTLGVIWRDYHYRVNYSNALGSHLLLNLGAGANILTRGDLISPPGPVLNGATTAGLPNTFSTYSPSMNIAGIGTVGPSLAGYESTPQWNIPAHADLNWNKGAHNMQFGAQYLDQHQIFKGCIGCSGTFTFSSQGTGLPGFFGQSGVGYADFLLGDIGGASITTPGDYHWRASATGLYAQDNWRVTPKLSVSYGIRFDTFSMLHEDHNQMTIFDPTLPNAGAGGFRGALSFFGSGPGRNGLTQMLPRINQWEPRIGLAYSPDKKTALRASYGNSSDLPFGADTTGGGLTTSGFVAGFGFTGNLSALDQGLAVTNWGQGYPLGTLPKLPDLDPTLLNGNSPAFWNINGVKAARSQNIVAGIERELPGNVIIKAVYVGNLVHGLPTNGLDQLNQLNPKYLALGSLLFDPINSPAAIAAGITAPYPGFTGPVSQALRPFPQYQNIPNVFAPIGYSEYNSLQTTVQKHFGGGLSFLVTYTFAKQLTNLSAFTGQGASEQTYNQNAYNTNIKFEDGSVRPQVFVASYVYDLPFGRGKSLANFDSPVLNQLVSGWRVSGVDTYFSGTPVGVGTNQGNPGGFGPTWADRVPGVPVQGNSSCGSFNPHNPNDTLLNIAAYTDAPAFGLGNSFQISGMRNCPYADEDLSLEKQFTVRERTTVQVGVDVNNIFNRHIWTGIVADVDVPSSYGKVAGASTPRFLQLHAKIQF
jgi:hypothetical protein